jgi:methylenetetrahydrofolate dehydrogenase (NADP+)/methenyltetrahydrofolate cyclohydrolase
MKSKILDGKSLSKKIISQVKTEIELISETNKIPKPKIGIILVGENPASESYVKSKIKSCKSADIEVELFRFSNQTSLEELLNQIDSINESPINGFIVQLPLPQHIDKDKVINRIRSEKDIDGFHPLNFGKMALGQDSLKPATPYGILKLLKNEKIETKGKHIVVVGRSNIVGKPLAIMLGNDFDIGRATVTSCDINTPRQLLEEELKKADIVVIAVGKPNFLNSELIKEGCVIIDVGINRLEDGRIVGDVDYESVLPKCSLITPVPGGIGPMTVSALICNTLLAWKKQNNLF